MKVFDLFEHPLFEVVCTNCGQCVTTATQPGHSLKEIISTRYGMQFMTKTKHVVVQTAPAVRIALGEALGMPAKIVTGKMVTALKQLGFNSVLILISQPTLPLLRKAMNF